LPGHVERFYVPESEKKRLPGHIERFYVHESEKKRLCGHIERFYVTESEKKEVARSRREVLRDRQKKHLRGK
jgi:hypothetical protein